MKPVPCSFPEVVKSFEKSDTIELIIESEFTEKATAKESSKLPV